MSRVKVHSQKPLVSAKHFLVNELAVSRIYSGEIVKLSTISGILLTYTLLQKGKL